MKRNFFFLCSALLPILVSCQKEDVNAPKQDGLIHKTVTIADTPWTSDSETKSLYEEGIGVHLNKLENLSVYYWKYTDGQTNQTKPSGMVWISDGVVASETGKWTFTHDPIDQSAKYNYFFVIPHTSMNQLNGDANGHSIRLSAVQAPETLHKFRGCETSPLSFDPTMDFHMGQAQYGVGIKTEIDGIHFKRLFTPLKLVISDSNNILEGEPAYAISFKSNAEATQKQTLTGIVYLKHSDSFDSATINSIASTTVGNGVSCVYKEPIAKDEDGKYVTWYIVNPTIIPESEITVTVTTGKKTVSRTVSASSLNIASNQINVINFNISGTGYIEEKTDYYSFNNDEAKLNQYAGSFSGSKPWTQTAMKPYADVTNSYYNYALRNSNIPGTLKYSASRTKASLSKVRIFGHPRSSTKDITITTKSGDNTISTISFKYDDINKNGGYVDVAIPEKYANADLQFCCDTGNSLISAILLFHRSESGND